MDVMAEGANDTSGVACVDEVESPDFGFLPNSLTAQCRSLIESYHELHGYACLPDILWKARLGPFIEGHRELRHILREASTTRSAKKSNEGFVRIATLLMSLEILASSFAGWSAIYPQAASRALAILKRTARNPHMPLMEFYLYPLKYLSSGATATLTPGAAAGWPQPPVNSGTFCGPALCGPPSVNNCCLSSPGPGAADEYRANLKINSRFAYFCFGENHVRPV